MTNIVYDKETRRIVVAEMNGEWVIPSNMELVSFDDNVTPVCKEVNGYLHMSTNAILVSPDFLK